MSSLISDLQIVLYILAGYSAIAVLHAPFYWLTAKTVWDERRAEAKQIISHCERFGFPRETDDPKWHESAWAIAMHHEYELDDEFPTWRFRREATLVQSIAWPIFDVCWMTHLLKGMRQ